MEGSSLLLERAMGIEQIRMNQILKAIDLAALSFPSDDLNWKLSGN
jgi:hypothetical protein